MISKLKTGLLTSWQVDIRLHLNVECGYQWTNKLEGMFKVCLCHMGFGLLMAVPRTCSYPKR